MLVKSWNAEKLIPSALKIYNELAMLTGTDFFHIVPIVEIYQSVHHRNEWMARSSDTLMQDWIGDDISPEKIPAHVIAPLGGISLKQSGWLDVNKFIFTSRHYFREKNYTVDDHVLESEINFEKNKVRWKNFTADRIIFCNGNESINSTLFNNLPFRLSKGELIEIESTELNLSFILNKSVFILPTSNNIYKVGSTFSWNDLNTNPTTEGKTFLTTELEKMISCPYKIMNHSAAIRPTTKDRRPIIGIDQKNNSVGIFNGLGTKGVMIAPYYAEHFARHLLFGEPLDKEVFFER